MKAMYCMAIASLRFLTQAAAIISTSNTTFPSAYLYGFGGRKQFIKITIL
jgi:hypothetical protein